MDTDTFTTLIFNQMDHCSDILNIKATEYATEDRLHNFKVAAEIEGITPVQALAGMMAKHTVSVYDLCFGRGSPSLSMWEEKITDSINYLLLLWALVNEEC